MIIVFTQAAFKQIAQSAAEVTDEGKNISENCHKSNKLDFV